MEKTVVVVVLAFLFSAAVCCRDPSGCGDHVLRSVTPAKAHHRQSGPRLRAGILPTHPRISLRTRKDSRSLEITNAWVGMVVEATISAWVSRGVNGSTNTGRLRDRGRTGWVYVHGTQTPGPVSRPISTAEK
jgi:hypothetical protein